jgi:hypothetical protein
MGKNEKPIEIADICYYLKPVIEADFVSDNTRAAARQGCELLRKFREVVLTGRNDSAIVEELRDVLSKQGEG